MLIVFDMDGTLTRAVHDFAALRRALDLPEGRPILEEISARPAPEAAALYARLDELEAELAARATPADGARALLEALRTRGARLGILTRNSRANALRTLRAAGLAAWFHEGDVLGRDEAAPKPSPAGVRALLERWQAPAARSVMGGDYRYDLEAGRAAGVTTVYVDDSGEFPFRALADCAITRLDALIAPTRSESA